MFSKHASLWLCFKLKVIFYENLNEVFPHSCLWHVYSSDLRLNRKFRVVTYYLMNEQPYWKKGRIQYDKHEYIQKDELSSSRNDSQVVKELQKDQTMIVTKWVCINLYLTKVYITTTWYKHIKLDCYRDHYELQFYSVQVNNKRWNIINLIYGCFCQ